MEESMSRTMLVAAVAMMAMIPAHTALAKNLLRGLQGSCSTEFTFTGPETALVTGACHYSHLGSTTCVAEQTVVPGDEGTLIIENEGVCTAANGDQLVTRFSGVGVPTPTGAIAFGGVETYHGGTGRFSEAGGGAFLWGSAQFTSATGGVGSFRLRGRIGY
jgi:hypothetical protein